MGHEVIPPHCVCGCVLVTCMGRLAVQMSVVSRVYSDSVYVKAGDNLQGTSKLLVQSI